MKKVHLLFLLQLLLCFPLLVCGQDFNNYKPVKSSGDIPQSFTITSTEKYEAEVKKISRQERRRDRRDKQNFYLESSFLVDQLLLSGKVLFNDPVTVYLNKVTDQLLKNDPELRSKIQVYAVKSPAVNAFTTNSGIIMVTMGLISRMQDESQLAYVLSHELTHYIKQHGLLGYIENRKIDRGKGVYRGVSLEQKLLARSVYSKKNESEADMYGLGIFLKTKYSFASVSGLFDVLKYSHLPFDSTPYNKEFLETQYLRLPESYFLKQTKIVEAEDKEDSLGTHPGAAARRDAVMAELKDKSNTGRQAYLVGEKEFMNVRKVCRYELCNIYLHERDYEAALYNAYLLMQTDADSKYLKKCVGKALYGLTKYANAQRYDEVHESYEKVQGKSQQVYYMFDKLHTKELSVVAVDYLWRLRREYPDDKEVNAITLDAFKEMVDKNYHKKTYFSTVPRSAKDSATEADTSAKSTQTGKKKVSKTTVVFSDEGSSSGKNNAKGPSFAKYAFVDLMQDTVFSHLYDKYVAEHEATKKTDKKRYVFYAPDGARIDSRALGIDKVVFINPFYYKYNEYKAESRQYLASEASQKVFTDYVSELSQKAGLKKEILDTKHLSVTATEMFNDITTLNEFMDEQYEHDDMNFINYLGDDLQSLPAKYGTRYFCWTGVVSVKDLPSFHAANCCLVVFYPLLPLIIYDWVHPRHATLVYSAVVDIQSGRKLDRTMSIYSYRDRYDVLRSTLYDIYSRYKKKPKK